MALRENGVGHEQVAAAAQGVHQSSQGISFSQVLQTSNAANTALKAIAVRRSPPAREQVNVVYFPKDVDGNVVTQALTQLGFGLTTAPAKQPKVPTNAVWAGDRVQLDDAKLVALVLIRAGVQIKFIGRIQNAKRDSVIEVGGAERHERLPALTVSEVEGLADYMQNK